HHFSLHILHFRWSTVNVLESRSLVPFLRRRCSAHCPDVIRPRRLCISEEVNIVIDHDLEDARCSIGGIEEVRLCLAH
ncbi:hypothetical protein PMAYCL1PPCAC_02431, partial [Pristionchus mayeri]